MLEPYNTTPFTPQKNLEGRLFSSFVNNSFRMEKNSSKRTYVLNRRILHYIKPWTVHLSQINPSSKQETKMRQKWERKKKKKEQTKRNNIRPFSFFSFPVYARRYSSIRSPYQLLKRISSWSLTVYNHICFWGLYLPQEGDYMYHGPIWHYFMHNSICKYIIYKILFISCNSSLPLSKIYLSITLMYH